MIGKSLRATRITAFLFGVFCGWLGLGHGYLEVLHGNVPTGGVAIDANNNLFNGRFPGFSGNEPAMTIIPNFLVTGILAIIVSLAIILWSTFLVQRKRGGIVLMALSVLLLFFGGGFTPIPFGILAGLAGIGINASYSWWRTHLPAGFWGSCGVLWPVFLLISVAWYPCLPVLRSALKADTTALGGFGVLLCLVAVLTAFANDIRYENYESRRAG